MYRPTPSFAARCALLVCIGAAAATASAGTHRFGDDAAGCSIESAHTLRVDTTHVRLEADADAEAGTPQRIELHGGRLLLDGVEQSVSAADAQRLRDLEQGTRALLPDIAGITREVIHITFDALAGVQTALGGGRREARAMDRARDRALDQVAATLDRGIWRPDDFGAGFEAEIEAAAESMAAAFTPARALWMVVSGGVGRMERRMARMEVELEDAIAARETALTAHARALCTRLEGLQALQDALDLRLEDGGRLRLFEVEPHAAVPDVDEGAHGSPATGA